MNIPQHVAIILDGNGRWAKAKGMPRNYGHAQGSKNVEAEKAAIDRHNEDEGHHRDKQVAQHGYQPERDAG